MPRRPTARELEAAAASRPAPPPGRGPPAGEVLAMLARRGLRPRPGTPDLPWPANLSPHVESRLRERLGHYAFRLFLRGAILSGPSFSPAGATRYLRAPRARAMAGELVAMGIAEPAGRGRYGAATIAATQNGPRMSAAFSDFALDTLDGLHAGDGTFPLADRIRAAASFT